MPSPLNDYALQPSSHDELRTLKNRRAGRVKCGAGSATAKLPRVCNESTVASCPTAEPNVLPRRRGCLYPRASGISLGGACAYPRPRTGHRRRRTSSYMEHHRPRSRTVGPQVRYYVQLERSPRPLIRPPTLRTRSAARRLPEPMFSSDFLHPLLPNQALHLPGPLDELHISESLHAGRGTRSAWFA